MRRYKALPTNLPEEEVEPIPLTQDFYQELQEKRKKLQAEFDQTKLRVKDAREMGDLSENGAYKYGKFELGKLGSQLKQISFLLQHGYVFTPPTTNDEVRFGSTVTLQPVSAEGKSIEDTIVFQLLSEYQADPAQGVISVKSPLGKKLLGVNVGEFVKVTLPKKSSTYVIISIE